MSLAWNFTRAENVSRQSAIRENLYRICSVRYILTAILTSVSMSQLLGCAAIQTYSGERLPRDKVAVIWNDAGCYPMTMNGVEIVAIDGKKLEYDDRTPNTSRRFAILPGRHKISVLMQGYKGFPVPHRLPGCSETTELTLNAIAGEAYALRASVSERPGETNERGCLLFFIPNSFRPGDTMLPGVFVHDCRP